MGIQEEISVFVSACLNGIMICAVYNAFRIVRRLIRHSLFSVLGEVPVGCVIIKDDVILGNGYNTRENNNDLFGHAEIMAIKDACNNLGCWKLDGCEMYVTMEPCDMCKSIIEESRINKVYYCIKKDRNKKFNTIYEPVDNYNIDVDEVFGDFFDSIRN